MRLVLAVLLAGCCNPYTPVPPPEGSEWKYEHSRVYTKHYMHPYTVATNTETREVRKRYDHARQWHMTSLPGGRPLPSNAQKQLAWAIKNFKYFMLILCAGFAVAAYRGRAGKTDPKCFELSKIVRKIREGNAS